jgi:hypothetical protein
MRARWTSEVAPLAQRLQDASPARAEKGIGSPLSRVIAGRLIGYAYNYPDTVGGGGISATHAQSTGISFPQIAAAWRSHPHSREYLAR